VLCVAARDIATRRLSAEVPSLAVALAAAVGVTVFFGLGAAATGEWVMPTPRGWATLGTTSAFIVAGYLLSVLMMRRGEVSVIAPFRYTSLVWALLLGFVVFGDWPDAVTLLGVVIVVATGSFTLWRTSRKGSVTTPATAPEP
jgi:drug/metabolite transporter (DMT)-like permease